MFHEGKDGLGAARGTCLGAVIMAVAIAAVFVLFLRGCGRAHAATVRSELALAKCRLIVETLYPESGFRPWCGTLLSEHTRYAAEKGVPAFEAEWWSSLVYSGANAGLKVGAVFPGNCCGPCDVKAFPLVREPGANIRHHVREAFEGWKRGYRGLGLARFVMYPARPHDYGRGKFRRTDAQHRAVISKAYKEGRL